MEPSPWDPEGATTVLDTDGQLAAGIAMPGLDVRSYYKQMVAARCLDLRLGRMGIPMFASAAGEEAALVATGMLAAQQDWIYPGLRDTAVAIVRGMQYTELAEQLTAPDGRLGTLRRVAAPHLGVAAPTDALAMHVALAAGQAHGQKLGADGGITFALLGEGATTAGAFHEAVAVAVARDLPLVIICRSQLWPNGAPAEAGVLGDSVADRARAWGLWERRVDGADPLAVWAALAAAAGRARDGRGPGLVEVVVTPLLFDPPAHRDPIERLRRHLDRTGEWTNTFQDVIEADVRTKLDRALTGQWGQRA